MQDIYRPKHVREALKMYFLINNQSIINDINKFNKNKNSKDTTEEYETLHVLKSTGLKLYEVMEVLNYNTYGYVFSAVYEKLCAGKIFVNRNIDNLETLPDCIAYSGFRVIDDFNTCKNFKDYRVITEEERKEYIEACDDLYFENKEEHGVWVEYFIDSLCEYVVEFIEAFYTEGPKTYNENSETDDISTEATDKDSSTEDDDSETVEEETDNYSIEIDETQYNQDSQE